MQACLPGYDCSTSVLPNESWCDLYPDAPGCLNGEPIISIIPPNWGDFDTQGLLNLCNCLNSGTCSLECSYTLPGEYQFVWQTEAQKEKEERAKRKSAQQGEECESENANDPWRVIPHYSDLSRPSRAAHGYGGWQGHHGINDDWMANLFDRVKNLLGKASSVYRKSDAPALLMPNKPYHNWTRSEYNTSGFNPKTDNWDAVKRLADAMFRRSKTTGDCEKKYWDLFKKYAKRIICQLIVEGASYAILPADVKRIWEFASDNGASPSETLCQDILDL